MKKRLKMCASENCRIYFGGESRGQQRFWPLFKQTQGTKRRPTSNRTALLQLVLYAGLHLLQTPVVLLLVLSASERVKRDVHIGVEQTRPSDQPGMTPTGTYTVSSFGGHSSLPDTHVSEEDAVAYLRTRQPTCGQSSLPDIFLKRIQQLS